PYGSLLNRPLTDGPGYTGHVMDAATGLTYMQQRYYDPMCGCFLSVDPVTAYSNGDWRFFNRYAYAFNNPYKFTDPDGRASLRMIADAFRVEVSAGLQLEAKAKLTNAVQLGGGLGSMSMGVGVSGAMDGYAFEEGRGPSLGVVVADKVQAGWTPSTNRSEQGRYNVPFTEHEEKGSFAFGLKKDSGSVSSETQVAPSPTEFSAKIGAIIGMEIKVDIGQAAYGLFSAKPGEQPAQEIEAKQQWKQYKEDVHP
ncbi:RHS repeat-associated core domain-containing protein, partial [Xanthomonas hyacinthi]